MALRLVAADAIPSMWMGGWMDLLRPPPSIRASGMQAVTRRHFHHEKVRQCESHDEA